MKFDAARKALLHLIDKHDTNLSEVSKAVGKNHAYFQQFIKRNSPRNLPEEVREALAEYFEVDPDVFRPVRRRRAKPTQDNVQLASGVPVTARVAAAFTLADDYDIPKENQERIALPPKWKGMTECFAAEVCDDSADRFYPEGSYVFFSDLQSAGDTLKEGSHCLVRHYANSRADQEIVEMRIMVVELSHDGLDIVLTSLTNNAQKRETRSIFRGDPEQAGFSLGKAKYKEAGAQLIEYMPRPEDKFEIIGVKVGALTP